jgi:hypothetical protein
LLFQGINSARGFLTAQQFLSGYLSTMKSAGVGIEQNKKPM